MAALFSIGGSDTLDTSKSTTQGTSATTSTQNATQNQNTNSSTTGNSTTNTSQTGTNNSTGSTSSTGTTQQQQSTTSQSLSDQILSALTGAVTSIFSNTGGSGQSAASTAAQSGAVGLGAFDPTTYVNNAIKAATISGNAGLQTALSGVKDQVGGAHNSMVSLLTNQLQDQNTANILQAGNAATTTAQGIANQNVNTESNVGTQANDFLTSLIGSLKGSQTTQQAAGTTQTGSDTNTSSADSTAQSGSSATSSSSDTVSSLVNILNTLLNSNTATNSTTNTSDNKATGSAGFSI